MKYKYGLFVLFCEKAVTWNDTEEDIFVVIGWHTGNMNLVFHFTLHRLSVMSLSQFLLK